MKLEIDRKTLADATRKLSKFSGAHLPVLSHFLLDAHSGIVALTATDLEAGRRIEVEAKIKTQGTVLVPSALARIVASATGETVTLSATETNLTITSGKASWRLPLGRVEDFPMTEPAVDGVKVPIENWDHIRAIATIAGSGKARPILQGVLFQDGEAVATDSYRLAHAKASETSEHPEALVPARAILALDEDVTAIEIGERQVYARTDDGAWWSRLIDGSFPKWQSLASVIEITAEVEVETARLVAAVKRAGSIADGAFPLQITPDEGVLKLAATRQDQTFTDETEAVVTGEGVAVGFNPAYLRSVIEPVARVKIEFQDAMKPARITGDDWWHAVLMPVRG